MVSKIKEKYGEFILLSLNSEKLLDNCLLLRKKIQEGFLKVQHFLEECIDMGSSLTNSLSSITFWVWP